MAGRREMPKPCHRTVGSDGCHCSSFISAGEIADYSQVSCIKELFENGRGCHGQSEQRELVPQRAV
ncbi:MAG: hypothetical protein PUH42_06995 [Firmicutes bacterium]|nr:hypothetical protein [Clostridiales bacterium]MDD7320789.1 hypothetical protein [Bacillota bacterium]